MRRVHVSLTPPPTALHPAHFSVPPSPFRSSLARSCSPSSSPSFLFSALVSPLAFPLFLQRPTIFSSLSLSLSLIGSSRSLSPVFPLPILSHLSLPPSRSLDLSSRRSLKSTPDFGKVASFNVKAELLRTRDVCDDIATRSAPEVRRRDFRKLFAQ